MSIRSALSRTKRLAGRLTAPERKAAPRPDHMARLQSLLANLQSETPEEYLVRTGPGPGDIGRDVRGVAEIEINDSCNLDCVMCRTSLAKRPKGLMELGLFEECVAWMVEIGRAHV